MVALFGVRAKRSEMAQICNRREPVRHTDNTVESVQDDERPWNDRRFHRYRKGIPLSGGRHQKVELSMPIDNPINAMDLLIR